MRTPYDVISTPIVTEKATIQKEGNKVTMKVAKAATKTEIKDAVERIFKVKVEDVNTVVVPGKWRKVGKSRAKTSSWKKAIVTVKAGEKLDFIEP